MQNHDNKSFKCIDHHLAHYDNIVIMGDFNSESTQLEIQEFCELFNLKNLVKEPSCYKHPDNPSCIDLILTNRKNMFCKTATIETGLSDFHKMTVTVMKTHFKKNPPKTVSYRDYKHYSHSNYKYWFDNFRYI